MQYKKEKLYLHPQQMSDLIRALAECAAMNMAGLNGSAAFEEWAQRELGCQVYTEYDVKVVW